MKRPVSFFVLCAILNTVSAQDLFDVASDSRELHTFLQLVRTAEMDRLLKGDGPYTVFAPENAAFLSLTNEERNLLMSNKAAARRVLSDHIVPGKVAVAEVSPGTAKTVDNSEISVKSDNGLVTVEDASVILSDIAADNGIIHVVDSLIRPAR